MKRSMNATSATALMVHITIELDCVWAFEVKSCILCGLYNRHRILGYLDVVCVTAMFRRTIAFGVGAVREPPLPDKVELMGRDRIVYIPLSIHERASHFLKGPMSSQQESSDVYGQSIVFDGLNVSNWDSPDVSAAWTRAE